MPQRVHHMPFGAQILPDGQVRFRFWAPGAESVELCTPDEPPQRCRPLAGAGDGWYETVRALPGRGGQYRYRINGVTDVPDPASRFQPRDIEDFSQVIDPSQWQWQDREWTGRPWEEAVIYELHVGTFTPQGSFSAVKQRLDYLRDLGVTAIELMPIADFPGRRNWGYDGVLLFSPDSAYGSPDDLKDLVQCAHSKGLMVFLDVVYNHFGPEGNYLHLYAPQFFTDMHHTPWGCAVNFDGAHSATVREFFIHNALYWLEEYHLDGLRFDAVHALRDDSRPDILEELSDRVRNGPGRERRIHLVLEHDNNCARYLRPSESQPAYFTAQWNDDIHHVLHVLLTGETSGYYQDYADNTLRYLARCLTQGFAYQGEVSEYRGGRPRGEVSTDLSPTAFVAFLQNHDQIGNRALGERLGELCSEEALRAATVIVLLAPSVPLLFMGQEWNATQPFPYFVDYNSDLGAKVTEGRLQEFAQFPQFSDENSLRRIPPPNEKATFLQAKLRWQDQEKSSHQEWLQLHRRLLRIRREWIQPRLSAIGNGNPVYQLADKASLRVNWTLADGSSLTLIANMCGTSEHCPWQAQGELLFAAQDDFLQQFRHKRLPPWAAAWFLAPSCRET